MHRRALLAAAAIVVLLLPGEARADNPRLTGTVGPGFTISLVDASGSAVRQLEPGTYDITVRDLSDEHNFHLFGPGVDRATTVGGTGTVTWTVTFRDGRYAYVCDPHPVMRGDFTAGTPPAPPPAPPAVKRLTASVGPGHTIALRNAAGALVRSLAAGPYTITVRDRSKLHNFHLLGPGVNRKTTLAGTGTSTWKVTLRKGTLAYFSDRKTPRLRRTVAVR
jgi:hypothetical protein